MEIEYKGKKYRYTKNGECENCFFYKDSCNDMLNEILGVDRGTCASEFGLFGHFEEVE